MGSNRFNKIFIQRNKYIQVYIHIGDNNARILYYELQYNTTFQQNDWISVQVERRRETYNEIKSQDGSIKLEPKTISESFKIINSKFL